METKLFFFFQAEDGIRDLTVTGVQTCALPICRAVGLPRPARRRRRTGRPRENGKLAWVCPWGTERHEGDRDIVAIRRGRSEERRVGKEWRSREWAYG